MDIPQSAATLRNRLREATSAAHARLDHHPVLGALVTDELSIEQYAAALAALCGPQRAMEAATLGAGLPAGYSIPIRSDALVQDLADLGVPDWPHCKDWPDCDSIAGAVGVLYVMEGSRLGGQLIARKLERSLPADTPRRFFGRVTPPDFAAFLRWAASVCPPEEHEQAAVMAERTFRAFESHLDACRRS